MKQLTGMDVHNAFVEAHNEENKEPLLECIEQWDKIGKRSQVLYSRMAEYLNALLIPEADLKVSSEKVLDIMAARGLDLRPYRKNQS